jgi:hypothetical protein
LESNIELSRAEFDRKESEARKHFPEILQMEENIARFERDFDKRRKDFPVILLVVRTIRQSLFIEEHQTHFSYSEQMRHRTPSNP